VETIIVGRRAIYAARLGLHHRAAVDLMRGAMHCWVVGVASIVVAVILAGAVVAMHAGLWRGNELDTVTLVVTLAFCELMVTLPTVRAISAGRTSVDVARVVIYGALLIALAVVARTIDARGPCVFALGVAATTALTGWRLARAEGAELARAATRI
jgi:hypothetical protein